MCKWCGPGSVFRSVSIELCFHSCVPARLVLPGYEWANTKSVGQISQSFLSSFFQPQTDFLNDWKNLSRFGDNVRKYRLMNAVSASFNTIMGQTTEISQRKKTGCWNYSAWHEMRAWYPFQINISDASIIAWMCVRSVLVCEVFWMFVAIMLRNIKLFPIVTRSLVFFFILKYTNTRTKQALLG